MDNKEIDVASVIGEARQKIQEAAKVLEGSVPKHLADAVQACDEACVYAAAWEEAKAFSIEACGHKWKRGSALNHVVCKGGHRYHMWAEGGFGEGWRLPTREELQELYKANPGSRVFEPIGYCEKDAGGNYVAKGVGHRTALWTNQDDSRDFAIEAVVTEEFGLTFHPALKTRLIAMWLIKED